MLTSCEDCGTRTHFHGRVKVSRLIHMCWNCKMGFHNKHCGNNDTRRSENCRCQFCGPIVELDVATRHPEDYLLINEKDGSRWRGTTSGTWVREGK